MDRFQRQVARKHRVMGFSDMRLKFMVVAEEKYLTGSGRRPRTATPVRVVTTLELELSERGGLDNFIHSHIV